MSQSGGKTSDKEIWRSMRNKHPSQWTSDEMKFAASYFPRKDARMWEKSRQKAQAAHTQKANKFLGPLKGHIDQALISRGRSPLPATVPRKARSKKIDRKPSSTIDRVPLDKMIHEMLTENKKKMDEHTRKLDTLHRNVSKVEKLEKTLKTLTLDPMQWEKTAQKKSLKRVGSPLPSTQRLMESHLAPHIDANLSGVMMMRNAGRMTKRHDRGDFCTVDAYASIGAFSVPADADVGSVVFQQLFCPSLFLKTEFYLDSLQFEKWRVKSAIMTIQPLVSTLANGAFVGFFHTDPDDEPGTYTGVPAGYSHKGAVTFNSGVVAEIRYPETTGWLYTDIASSPEKRTSDAGYMVVSYMGGITDSAMFDTVLWQVGLEAVLEFSNRRITSDSDLPFAEVVAGDPGVFLGEKDPRIGAQPHDSLFEDGAIEYSRNIVVDINELGDIAINLAQFYGSQFFCGLDLDISSSDAVAQLGDVIQALTAFTVVEEETGFITVDPTAHQIFSWSAIIAPTLLAATGIMSFSLAQAGTAVLINAVKLFISVLPEEVETLDDAKRVLPNLCRVRGKHMAPKMPEHLRLMQMRQLVKSQGDCFERNRKKNEKLPMYLTIPEKSDVKSITDIPLSDAVVCALYAWKETPTVIPDLSGTYLCATPGIGYTMADYNFKITQVTSTRWGFTVASDTANSPMSALTIVVEYWWNEAASYDSHIVSSNSSNMSLVYRDASPFTLSTRVEYWEFYPVDSEATRFAPGDYWIDLTLFNDISGTRTLELLNIEMIAWGVEGPHLLKTGQHMLKRKVQNKMKLLKELHEKEISNIVNVEYALAMTDKDKMNCGDDLIGIPQKNDIICAAEVTLADDTVPNFIDLPPAFQFYPFSGSYASLYSRLHDAIMTVDVTGQNIVFNLTDTVPPIGRVIVLFRTDFTSTASFTPTFTVTKVVGPSGVTTRWYGRDATFGIESASYTKIWEIAPVIGVDGINQILSGGSYIYKVSFLNNSAGTTNITHMSCKVLFWPVGNYVAPELPDLSEEVQSSLTKEEEEMLRKYRKDLRNNKKRRTCSLAKSSLDL